MPRDTRSKLQAGTRRAYSFGKTFTGTPPVGSYSHSFQFAGWPSVGSYASFAAAALARQQISGGASPTIDSGYQVVTNPTSPRKNYLTKQTFRGLTANGQGTLYLLDWLCTYKGIDANVSTLQTMTSSAANTDQRPRTYSDRSIIFGDVSVALGAGAANLTVGYSSTKAGNPSGRLTIAQALTASAPAGRVPHTFFFLPLQGDDPGVASIQTAQLSAAMGAGGVLSLNLANVLAEVTTITSSQAVTVNYGEDANGLIEIPAGAALTWLWCPTVAVATQNGNGTLEITEADLAAA